ncbi:hypothetical protein [Paenibacillus sp. FSL H8-0034]|uniref:hypothetical protein n=1 Tax=Paenibacillus sp. FSL H8-0034 TaxID=2954671 RepID=UPI0030F50000
MSKMEAYSLKTLAYIQENFGDTSADPVLATSEALNAYHKSLGFVFKADEKTFILYAHVSLF